MCIRDSRFIAARLFGEPFRVVKVDKSAVEYYARLTDFYAQFRAVAVNYNQVVQALHSNFSEKKALAFLYKLEKATTELAVLNRQVIDLTNAVSYTHLERHVGTVLCLRVHVEHPVIGVNPLD